MPALSGKGIAQEGLSYWARLDTVRAKQLLESLRERNPLYRPKDFPLNVTQLLWEPRPDRGATVLLVIGAGALAQLYDGVAANRLRDEINRRGDGKKCQFAAVITDQAVLRESVFLECPVIAIGGPDVNRVSARFTKELPRDGLSTERFSIHADLPKRDRRVALWGDAGLDTADAVECFVREHVLDKFLHMIWRGTVNKVTDSHRRPSTGEE